MSIRFECFGMTILKAIAIDLKSPVDDETWGAGGVLILALPHKGKISLFMPFTTAEEYANAINACNDKEVSNAHENTDANSGAGSDNRGSMHDEDIDSYIRSGRGR